MMTPTRHARNYAETAGMSVAFGYCVTTCDVFTTPTMSGYIHNVRKPQEILFPITALFGIHAMKQWEYLMKAADRLAMDRGHDPCSYGVALHRTHDSVTMSIIRHHYSLDECIAAAQAEGTEHMVRNLNEYDKPILLESA